LNKGTDRQTDRRTSSEGGIHFLPL